MKIKLFPETGQSTEAHSLLLLQVLSVRSKVGTSKMQNWEESVSVWVTKDAFLEQVRFAHSFILQTGTGVQLPEAGSAQELPGERQTVIGVVTK